MRIPLFLYKLGIRSDLLHGLGVASIFGSVSLWGRSAAKSDYQKRARSERLAIFVGLWPPTFFLLGKVLQDLEHSSDEQAAMARSANGSAVVDVVKMPAC